ncbi:MAG: uracil-DNA glycosylase [Thiomargarita sp.]|nr:uracil-DNA glycosylase [Thiomargarita sp.]
MEADVKKDQQAQYLKFMGIQVWVRRSLSEPINVSSNNLVEPKFSETNNISVNSENIVTQKLAVSNEKDKIITETEPSQEINDKPDWQTLKTQVTNCTTCELHKTRTQTVFGVGNSKAELMFVGEAPGADEDAQGEPFVGQSGQLLTEMLYAINLTRESVYIANIIKCRPPNNRNPHVNEIHSCQSFLQRQIELIEPKIIIAIGRVAAHSLLSTTISISKLRLQRFEYGENHIPLVVTYHPAYLLRSPLEKRRSWQDLKFICQIINKV